MKAVLSFSLVTFFSILACANGEVRFNEVHETKWSQEFLSQYQKAKNYGDLIKNDPTLSAVDVAILDRVVKPSEPLPKLKLKGNTFIFENSLKVKIISLNDYSFSIDGKGYQYMPRQGLAPNLLKINQVISRKHSSQFSLFFTTASAEELSLALTRKDYEKPTVSSFVQDVAVPVVAGQVLMPIHYLVVQAEAAISPSCEKQIKELKQILEDQKLGLASMNCDKIDRRSFQKGIDDKVISFWTSENVERKFNVDWINGLAWDDPNNAYVFDHNELIEYKAIKGKNGHITKNSPPEIDLKRVEYKKGSAEFEKAKQRIEPFRKVFKYIGDNRSCYKCQEEIRASLVSTNPSSRVNPPNAVGSPAGSAQ